MVCFARDGEESVDPSVAVSFNDLCLAQLLFYALLVKMSCQIVKDLFVQLIVKLLCSHKSWLACQFRVAYIACISCIEVFVQILL